jgi:hypothetical protein
LLKPVLGEAAWAVAFNNVITTIVHEHAKSNRACNIFSFDVLGFLYGLCFSLF